MNLGKKLVYRTFQKIMHLLIPFFPYREPKLLDSVVDVKDLLCSTKKSFYYEQENI
jgi:hypothetical protein